jgi:rhodanese-related sulfurtransferase
MLPPPVPTLDPEELHVLLTSDQPLWLVYAPARAPFAMGHIPGSATLPDRDTLAVLADGQRVVVYGEDGNCPSASRLARELATRGIRVALLAGGLAAWIAAGHPAEGVSPLTATSESLHAEHP